MKRAKTTLSGKIVIAKKWYRSTIKKNHHVKLSPYHKLRAILYGFSSDRYYVYQLDKNNPRDYISEFRRMITKDLNNKYKPIFDNKFIFERVFSNYVDIPKTVAIIEDNVYTSDGEFIDEFNINKILKNDMYIIKPTCGGDFGGDGISGLKKDGKNYIINDKVFSAAQLCEELKNKFEGYIICEYAEQHEYSKKINPGSVNTIRLITIKDPVTNEHSIVFATHRFGSSRSKIVDNVGSGGYFTKIDVKTGTLMDTTTDPTYKNPHPAMLDTHPDTGVRIKGTVIPHWEEVTTKLLEVAKKFPWLPFIAWDVVITKDGFSIIEINASCGAGLYQTFNSAKELGLYDFYKYYGYLR